MYQANLGNSLSMQVGIFRESDSYGDDKESNNNTNTTGRLTYLVMNNSNKLLHIGAAMSNRKNNDNTYGFSVRPENHLGNKLMTPSFSNVNETNITGLEIAYVSGRLSLQGEYVITTVSAVTEHELTGYYGQVSYFLTGESRPYKNSYTGFSRVKPKANYDPGKGAIELAARVSQMDLTKVNMGILDNTTIGVNWYLNPYTRVMLNYVMGEMSEGTEITTENAVMMRLQVDF